MKPGRDLDVEIEEKVFGNKPIYDKVILEHVRPKYANTPVPNYSQDIASAWLVIDKLKGHFKNIGFSYIGEEVTVYTSTESVLNFERILATGENVAHAICLSALKILNEE